MPSADGSRGGLIFGGAYPRAARKDIMTMTNNSNTFQIGDHVETARADQEYYSGRVVEVRDFSPPIVVDVSEPGMAIGVFVYVWPESIKRVRRCAD